MASFSVVSATGMLGSGFQPESLDKAIALGAEMIGCDAGSTDGGPSYLARGGSHFSEPAMKRDAEAILTRAVPKKLPVVIGSAGTAGSDATLATMVGLVKEIARENKLNFRMAVIHSEQTKETVLRHLRENRARALPPAAPLDEAMVEESLHIVAMMGVEPIQKAFADGADVVIAGRSSDTSIFAALPLLKGFDAGIVWHMAKILECGAAAVTQRLAPDSMMAVLHDESFDVFPLREDYRCSAQSIASHTLYENADPFELVEPSGTLYTREARYEEISDRAVRVSGSRFVRNENGYTVKLEGARQAGYSTIVPGAVRDPYILAEMDEWLAQLDRSIRARLLRTIGNRKYEIVTRVYGRDGVMGALEPTPRTEGHEAFILWDVISESQELSRTIATSLSHMAVHNPIPKWHGLISGVAFPYSPAEIDRGPVYEFHLNHVLVPDDPTALFRTEFEEV
ncbi:MAG TPA: acyclic terpene utilization AtuA family protein [Acetobacteraceae bacterium]|nr:acyclic terpene utilization AtuA family protein [Acetobacteraceae bacterium]